MATDNPILKQASKSQDIKPSVNLAAVQESIQVNTANSVNNIKALEEGAKQSTIATETISGSLKAMTLADQIVSLTTETAGLEAQNATINAYGASGGLAVQTDLMKQLIIDSSRVQKLLDEKQAIVNTEHTGIQLIDSLINEFSSFNTDLQIQAAQAQRNQTISDISAITESTESISKAQLLTSKAITAGTIQANYEKLAAAGNIEAAKADIANIQVNATATSRIMQAGRELTDNLISLYKFEDEAENRAVAKEKLAFDRESMVQARQKWADGTKSRAVALETAQLYLATTKATNPSGIPAAIARNEAAVRDSKAQIALEAQITRSGQAGQSLAGMTIEEPEMIIRGLQSTNPATRTKYEKIIALGSPAVPVMGSTPSEAYINYSTVNPSGTLPATKATNVLKTIERQQTEAFAKSPATVPKGTEAIQADFDMRARQFMESKAQEIKTGDTSNPYVGAPFSVLAEANAVKTTPLFKKVLEAKGMKELNPDTILEAALAGMIAKVVTPSEAANGIATIFKTAALLNNTESGGYNRAGLPNQTSYNVQVTRETTMFENLAITGSVLYHTPVLMAYTATDVITGDGKNRYANTVSDIAIRYGTLNLMDEVAVQLHLIKLMSAQGKTTQPASGYPFNYQP